MKIFNLFLLVMISACSTSKQVDVHPVHICDLNYTKYQATVTGYCQEAAANLPKTVPIIEKSIELRAISEIPEVFWFNQKMNYSLVKQDKKSPLIFIIAGTGASYNSSKMQSLQKALYQQGYHVISISSPTFANYIINATTKNDVPGNLERDAETLYGVMKKVLAQVKQEDNIEASSFSLTGYSLGGAHSAFIAKLDHAAEQVKIAMKQAKALAEQQKQLWLIQKQKVRAVELLRTNAMKKMAVVAARKEQKMFDEMSTQQFVRRHLSSF